MVFRQIVCNGGFDSEPAITNAMEFFINEFNGFLVIVMIFDRCVELIRSTIGDSKVPVHKAMGIPK